MFQNDIQTDNGELNDRQKVKIVSTLTEFVWLNSMFKPAQVNYTDETNTQSSYKKQIGETKIKLITK